MEIHNEQEYAKLLAKALPHVIHTEEENARCMAVLEALLGKRHRTREEKRLAELLTLLTEDFEGKHYSLPTASPVEILRHLMDSNGLRQADLIDIFGTASVASEVLNGKRACPNRISRGSANGFIYRRSCSSKRPLTPG